MKNQSFKISISNGTVTAIYDDCHADFMALGKSNVRRASHVEPCSDGWQADMSPVSGPVLGPFRLRQDALAAEIQYLESKLF